jgi:ATP phosphoribosyltransferase regulatory subunit
MSDFAEKALLPAGLSDLLAPGAALEAEVTESLMAAFKARGYGRVKPPLMEFEQSLFAGGGRALADWTFRVMDPESRKMMGVRPDMTTQAARIAATRLTKAPRPLRLSYSGQVLRVKGSQLRPERQFGQAGAEIFGCEAAQAAEADAEIILMAAAALAAVGVADISVDLGLPTLVPAIAAGLGLDPDTERNLRKALDRKDAAAVASLGEGIGGGKALFEALIKVTGPAGKAIKALAALDLPAAAAAERLSLIRVADALGADGGGPKLTIDVVENRGFEYHTGVTYTFFAKNVRGELGRGGRYRTAAAEGEGEAASGLTLFMDSVLRAIPGAALARHSAAKRLFLPAATPADVGGRLRAEGWTTISGLGRTSDPAGEAERLGCGHWLDNGTVRDLDG